ncbi:hypothetical protein NESM_000435300 [Novymonas esmeraldas]|uniref:BAR domain-containing protein n=1 Tax=Novymonas esmeraldas TaxID=1808958 RepID=A0AAW0ELQ9_9TRYP
MSYVEEYAQSVLATFRAPSGFCHDLQHVMSGAVKNLSQSREILLHSPERFAQFQAIFNALQTVMDTNANMTRLTANDSETLTQQESTGDFLAGSAAEYNSGTHHHSLSAGTRRTSIVSSHKTVQSFGPAEEQLLASVLTAEQLAQLSAVRLKAERLQTDSAALKAAEEKVAKYAKEKKKSKLAEAEKMCAGLESEVRRATTALHEELDSFFPALYKHVLQQYIDLCNSLLAATYVGTRVAAEAHANRGGDVAAAATSTQAVKPAPGSGGGSPELTVHALEVHEAFEETRQHIAAATAAATATPGEYETVAAAHATNSGVVPPVASTPPTAATVGSSSDTPAHVSRTLGYPLHEVTSSRVTSATLAMEPTVSSVATAAPNGDGRAAAPRPDSAQSSGTFLHVDSAITAPSQTTSGDGGAEDPDTPPFVSSPVGAADGAAAATGLAPPAAPPAQSRFPFWFRYYYFDRLVNSTGRLLVAYGIYVSYCKRVARKAGYTIPMSIKRHMDRVEMDFNAARYDRHKREFQTVLQGIFTYRKNLEAMSTRVRAARVAEARVAKYTAAKKKVKVRKWQAELDAENARIAQLHHDVFGRGAEEMVLFYEELLRCIQRFLADLVATLGGTPEEPKIAPV